MGQFTQPDPSGIESNYYAYVQGNPISWTDPSGYCRSWLTPMRSLFPNWCHNIDDANSTIIDWYNGKAPANEGVGALGYVVGSGVLVGLPIGLAADACIALGGEVCVGRALIGIGSSALLADARIEMAKQSSHPELQAWAEQDSESFYWNSVWAGGIAGPVFGGHLI